MTYSQVNLSGQQAADGGDSMTVCERQGHVDPCHGYAGNYLPKAGDQLFSERCEVVYSITFSYMVIKLSIAMFTNCALNHKRKVILQIHHQNIPMIYTEYTTNTPEFPITVDCFRF
jgi:hypothetical protein